MKKRIAMLLILTYLVCLAGCSSTEPVEAEEGFAFTYNEIQIMMNGEAAPVLAALGEPKTCTEEASCAFEGLDKTYYYGSFYLTTYPMEGSDYVYRLWFADDSVSTDEGIRIGSTREEVEAAYGSGVFDGSGTCTLTRADTKLIILLTQDVVSSVQYEAIVV